MKLPPSPARAATGPAPETDAAAAAVPAAPGTTPAAPLAPSVGSLADEVRAAGSVGGIAIAELAGRFGTPLYVYDLDLVRARVAALAAVLPERARLAYAVKANPALAVVAEMARAAICADVASAGELATVLRAGFEAERIVFTGPGKRDHEIAAAIAAGSRGIGAFTVESPGELHRVESAAADAGRRQRVLLRLAVADEAGTERVRLIGHEGGGKFGMDAGTLGEAARYAAASPHLELLGLHAFGASNVLVPELLVEHAARLVATAREVALDAGFPLRLVDIGGGLGIPYRDDETALDIVALGAGLASLSAQWDADPRLARMALIVEPGRFLVGPAGLYLSRIVDVKGPDAHPVAILDGGIHHAVRPALVRTEQRLALVAADAAGRDRVPATVAGPLCTGLDVFASAAELPRPRAGDLVALLDAGAYGFTESMPFFLSHATPAEVAVRGGEARLIRPQLTAAEMLERQIAPDWSAGSGQRA